MIFPRILLCGCRADVSGAISVSRVSGRKPASPVIPTISVSTNEKSVPSPSVSSRVISSSDNSHSQDD